MLTVSIATIFTSRAKAMDLFQSLAVICLVAVLGIGPAAAAEPASGAAVNSLKEIRETLDAGNKLLEEGKPGKAAARVAEHVVRLGRADDELRAQRRVADLDASEARVGELAGE